MKRPQDMPTVQRVACEDGFAEMTSYALYPGLTLQFNEISCACLPEEAADTDMLEMNYCLEGAYECELQPGCAVSLKADGFAVSMLGAEHLTSCFPTGRYRGISLLLDADVVLDVLDARYLLRDVLRPPLGVTGVHRP